MSTTYIVRLTLTVEEMVRLEGLLLAGKTWYKEKGWGYIAPEAQSLTLISKFQSEVDNACEGEKANV